MTDYTRLNEGWNAEPNAPDVRITCEGDALRVSFILNSFVFPGYEHGQRATLTFPQCTRYRFGPPNDEGWYAGAHGLADPPPWGEFYEIAPAVKRTNAVNDWVTGPAIATAGQSGRHFLFYFRDDTFECEAADWLLETSGEAVGYRARAG